MAVATEDGRPPWLGMEPTRNLQAICIDGLYCTQETAEDTVRSVIANTYREADQVRSEVAAAVSERIQALQARQQQLLDEIDVLVQSKVQVHHLANFQSI
ncbi:unnamed protein product [Effrenium voratum]|uniref:Uncharacterized protein n=1 Tax=Effrenium voratum TaxID=2562239 RepID=A0AA36I3T5_9DINO|nr:unnamed protein product [Effrenium voratum]